MTTQENKLIFEKLEGVCFDTPAHELLPTKHWSFKVLPMSPAWIQLHKHRLRIALGLKVDPYAQQRNSLLFIHIPKNAGNSLVRSRFEQGYVWLNGRERVLHSDQL